MADNTAVTPGAGVSIATRAVTYSGDAVQAQAVGLVTFAGLDDAKTVADVPAGEGAAATALRVDLATDGTVIGIVTEAAPATDTASSGLNGRLQRIAQRLTSLITLQGAGLPAALGQASALKVEGALGVSASAGALNPVLVGGLDGSNALRQLTVDQFSSDGNNFSTARFALVAAPGLLYNGSTTDRQRSNVDATLLASAARTVTTASPDQTNYNGGGVHVVLDMTVVGTGSVTLTIQGLDALSGKYYTILAGAAVTTNSTNVYRVYPGLLAALNAIANDHLPRTWRVNVVANNANSAVYSVGVSNVL